jgi:hypothetical protein
MGTGSNCDDGPTGLNIVYEDLHLIVGKIAPPHEQHHQICFAERLETRDAPVIFRVDRPVGRVDRKQHGALEPVVNRQNFGKLRKCFLGVIFSVIAGNQHNVFAVSGAAFAFVCNARGVSLERCRQQQRG